MRLVPKLIVILFLCLIPVIIIANFFGLATDMEMLVVIAHSIILAFFIWIDELSSNKARSLARQAWLK